MDNKNRILLIFLFAFESEQRIKWVYNQVLSVMEIEKIFFELIIVDGGSKDNSFVETCLFEKADNRVAFQLSKNCTSHYAGFRSMSVCESARFVAIPDDLQTLLDIIVNMYRLWENRNKIVVPFRASKKDGVFSDFFSRLYYGVMNTISDVNFPKGGADGFLVDCEVIDNLNERIHPINNFPIVEVLGLGFDSVYFPFNRPPAKSKSRWIFKKKLKLAADSIFSSSFPIKCIIYIGFASVIISILFLFLAVILKLSGNKNLFGFSIPGWTSAFELISLFSGLLLFSLGIKAEYIWQIYDELKDRPGYII